MTPFNSDAPSLAALAWSAPTRDRPVNEDEMAHLAELALDRAEVERPGHAEHLARWLDLVLRRWAEDWVTSFMGGGGGTTVACQDGVVLVCWPGHPFAYWDVRFGYAGGEWRPIEWAAPQDAEEHYTLVEALMFGLQFEVPNIYRWPSYRR